MAIILQTYIKHTKKYYYYILPSCFVLFATSCRSGSGQEQSAVCLPECMCETRRGKMRLTAGWHVLSWNQQTRSEWRASSRQMKADRWLFPQPGISHEVSMFIMMILIILLTCPFFFGHMILHSGIPGRRKLRESSVIREHPTALLTGLLGDHADARVWGLSSQRSADIIPCFSVYPRCV